MFPWNVPESVRDISDTSLGCFLDVPILSSGKVSGTSLGCCLECPLELELHFRHLQWAFSLASQACLVFLWRGYAARKIMPSCGQLVEGKDMRCFRWQRAHELALHSALLGALHHTTSAMNPPAPKLQCFVGACLAYLQPGNKRKSWMSHVSARIYAAWHERWLTSRFRRQSRSAASDLLRLDEYMHKLSKASRQASG